MPINKDISRVSYTFGIASGGMDGGSNPDLINPDQYALGINLTNRGNFVKTRPPWGKLPLSFSGVEGDTTESRWTGKYQGAMVYQGITPDQTCWIVSRGGRLFRIAKDTRIVTEITPVLLITTTEDFVVPAIGNTVTIQVISETPFVTGDTIFILGEEYLVSNRGANELFLTNVNAVSVLTATTANFVQPAASASVNVQVADSSWASVGQLVYVATGGYYSVSAIPDATHVTLVNRGDTGNAAPTTVIAFPQDINVVMLSGAPIYFTGNIQAKEWQTHDPNAELIYMFQAELWAIICRGQFKTVFFDGVSSRLSGFREIPPCVLGAYGWGRIWYTFNDYRTYGAGDLIYGDSGTPFYRRRDAILKVTENDFLNEGGTFPAPQNAGPITSMQFLETQDTSLGMGVLLMGTTNGVFSNNAPVDRTTWKNLTYPIQTISLLDYGPQGPRSTISVNADMWHRALDGVRTFIVARRNFSQPGNTPVSFEVSNILNQDTSFLLQFSSAVQFDNKLFMTVSPHRTDNGIQHAGLVVINFDLVSKLRGKFPPAWEGLYTGLNIMQTFKGTIDGQERGFIFAINDDDELELWEMFKDGTYDTDEVIEPPVITRTPIKTVIETGSSDFGAGPDNMLNLLMGMIWLDDIVDEITVSVKWRPDELPTWLDWKSFTICADVSQCEPPPNCQVWKPKARGYVARYTLPQPPESCSEVGIPVRLGFMFQFRIEITGHARMKMFRAGAKIVTVPMEGSDACTNKACQVINGCKIGFFNYNSSGN